MAKTCADALAGRTRATRSQPAWHQAYRALDHREAKKRCERNEILRTFPAGIQDFAETFISLQSKRHLADHDPDAPFGKTNVIEDIDEARDAIARFLQAPLRHRRAFAIYLPSRSIC